jgi:hypothetical protein
MDQMPRGYQTVLSSVLAHWRDPRSVSEGAITDGQRIEQLVHLEAPAATFVIHIPNRRVQAVDLVVHNKNECA